MVRSAPLRSGRGCPSLRETHPEKVMDRYEEKVAGLMKRLGSLPGALVAFSGGVDSTMLLAAAAEALGRERTLAVTADSPSFPKAEKGESLRLARDLEVRQVFLQTEELDLPGYRENGPDRCYHCKAELFRKIRSQVQAGNLPDWPVLYGETADDKGDHRPGSEAAREWNVLAPLAEFGFTKEEIRRFSKERGLRTWEKPSFACLASRIPYGTPIDREVLERVEKAEAYLRERGFRQYRVRHHGEIARIELPPQDIPRASGPEREGLVERFKALGYAFVVLDLEGFRSGSLNRLLPGAGRS